MRFWDLGGVTKNGRVQNAWPYIYSIKNLKWFHVEPNMVLKSLLVPFSASLKNLKGFKIWDKEKF